MPNDYLHERTDRFTPAMNTVFNQLVYDHARYTYTDPVTGITYDADTLGAESPEDLLAILMADRDQHGDRAASPHLIAHLVSMAKAVLT